MSSAANCIFCKIVKGDIPCLKLIETPKTLAFMDIQPTASGHALIIPKHHGAMLHNIPDDYLQELLPVAKKIAIASGLDVNDPNTVGYNILQNNGRIAHQVVDHVHVHLIPKRDQATGLGVGWPSDAGAAERVKELHAELLKKLGDDAAKM
ncbi:adenosine 5'-monophosphoramidase Hnt1p [Trichomonascus vanleenenianus]|uniref:adenosine 5'-monophosphoramidase Hnt1p n=1 Tax=Trichomonascus vanleenenianus TaxID=2268995 RepID=UPI003ECA416E